MPRCWKSVKPPSSQASATRNGRTAVSVGSAWPSRNSLLDEPASRAQSQPVQAQYACPVSAQCCKMIPAACAAGPPVDIAAVMVKAGRRLIERPGQPGQSLP